MNNSSKEKFINFIKLNFNIDDDKIKHKLEHTFNVVLNAEYICKELKLDDENIELAKLIALLHDFGRFYEAKDYQSFREDLIEMDHAKLGIELLYKNNLIRQFIEDDKYDEIIKSAIINHNKYILDITQMNENQILHSKIIRDADKIDSFRTKSVENIYTMANITQEDIESSIISDTVYNDFMNEKTIFTKDRKTALDIWVSYIAFIFELNFDISLKFIKEKNYIDIMINRFNYKNSIAKDQMLEIKNKVNDFFNRNKYMY